MRSLVVTIWLLSFVGAAFAASAAPSALAPGVDADVYKNFNIFVEVLDLVRAYYLEPVDVDLLVAGAINGMVLRIDRYGYYLPPEGLPDVDRSAGVGLLYGFRGGHLAVIRTIPGSPADGEDIETGDVVFTIDGSYPQFLTIPAVERLLHKPAGEALTLQLLRDGENKVHDVTLVAGLLPMETACDVKTEDGIRIVAVRDLDSTQSAEAIAAAASATLDGLVLDLRGCSRGGEENGFAMADLFLPDAQIKGSLMGREDKVLEPLRGSDGRQAADFPMVVLVDETTYGGAEVLAAALQAAGKAVVIGRGTYGRGIKQTRTPLDVGGAVVLTSGLYAFSDHPLLDKGITPDVADTDDLRVELRETAGDTPDPLLTRALIEVRRKHAATP
ncbi:PDZ domain-containing protein [bacterium]|nr:PDZ domain-containing protein [candidate division CSSED10-310 bacterium]